MHRQMRLWLLEGRLTRMGLPAFLVRLILRILPERCLPPLRSGNNE